MKLGLEFFAAHGPAGVREAAGAQKNLFLDLKLHDIPNTVGKAIQALRPLEPAILTVHAAGGRAMLEDAKAAAPTGTKVVAVTVLTSLDATDLANRTHVDTRAARDFFDALVAMDAKEAVPTLREWLAGTEAPAVRALAAEGLRHLAGKDAVEALSAALRDADEEVAKAAAASLGSLREAGAVEPLGAVLGNPDASAWLRYEAKTSALPSSAAQTPTGTNSWPIDMCMGVRMRFSG